MRKHRQIALSALIVLAISTGLITYSLTNGPSSAGASGNLPKVHPKLVLANSTRAEQARLEAQETAQQAQWAADAHALLVLAYVQAVKSWDLQLLVDTLFYEEVAANQAAAASAPAVHHHYSSSGGSSGGGGPGGRWAAIRQCESGGNYSTNTGNGYYGAYQFSQSTWQSLGYSGLPSNAPAAVQDQAAQQLEARSGWGQWPVCGSR